MAVELVEDRALHCTRLWVTEPVTVTVLNQGADWETVRERVRMYTLPLNTTSGCPRFLSCILGLPVVRYMSHTSGGLFATDGGTALRIELKQEHLPRELDYLAEKHNLFAHQQGKRPTQPPLSKSELTDKVVDALADAAPTMGLLDAISDELSILFGFHIEVGVDGMGIPFVTGPRKMTNEQKHFAREYAAARLQ